MLLYLKDGCVASYTFGQIQQIHLKVVCINLVQTPIQSARSFPKFLPLPHATAAAEIRLFPLRGLSLFAG